jgi:uncharacterized protein (DUF433 family)
MNYSNYISIDPQIRFGRPCIIGSRISVYDVLGWLASGLSVDQILSDYPELKEVEVRACLAYAADKEHRIRNAS